MDRLVAVTWEWCEIYGMVLKTGLGLDCSVFWGRTGVQKETQATLARSIKERLLGRWHTSRSPNTAQL